MSQCLFVSDLHGRVDRYEKLFDVIRSDRPSVVFLGGDLTPHFADASGHDDFLDDFISNNLLRLRDSLGADYPDIFAILGNDDPRAEEDKARELDARDLWHYVHNANHQVAGHSVLGYSYVPPTPFLNKDWEKYDVSRYVPPGAVSPEEGFRSIPVEPRETRNATILSDLDRLTAEIDLMRAVILFHTPPYDTNLDRAATDGKMVEHVPLDLHVGSIAVHRFIEKRQPLLTLHGHIHESARLTGSWRDRIGGTHMFSAAHDGPELCVVHFDLEDLESAERTLL
jgi:Icc-related predicted phosphoesterase